MITVHHLNNSRSQRILWLLEELGLGYEIAAYQRDPETKRAPDTLKAIHPLGKAPVISDDGRVVAESGAIVEYIVERHGAGRLAPKPHSDEYWTYLEWLHYAEGSAFFPFLLDMVLSWGGPGAASLLPLAEDEVGKQLRFIDATLAERDYLLPSGFSAADINLAFILEFAQPYGWLKDYPRLDAYLARLRARPAYQRALQKGGPYDLSGFKQVLMP